MKVITNEPMIAKRKKLANILSPIAMVLLLAGLGLNIMSLRNSNDGQITPIYFYGTLGLLILGFIFSNISSHLVNHWVREPRADQTLQKALKGFDNKTFLFNYMQKAPHILVTPQKVYVITTKGQKDTVSVNGDRWKRPFSLMRALRFFAEESFGNPTYEAQQNAKAAATALSYALPDDAPQVTLEPLIVFTHPDVDLTVNEPTIPVLKASKLKSFIREDTKTSAMPFEMRQAIIKALSGDSA